MITRLSSYMVFAGVLLLFASLVLSSALIAQWRQWSGPVSFFKLSASVEWAADPAGAAGLTARQAERLSAEWGASAAYSARMPGTASANGRSAAGDVIGVGGTYDRFTHLWLLQGVSVSAGAMRDHARVAVIGSELADRLFRSQDVAGLHLELMNADFRIAGVYKERDSLLGWMTDDGVPDILIPFTALADLEPAVTVQMVDMEAKGVSTIPAETEAGAALTAAGAHASGFVMTNFIQTSNKIVQKPALLLWICGLAAIWQCLRIMAARVRSLYRIIRRERQMEEWSEFLARRRRVLTVDAANVTAAAVGIVGIWLLIRYPFYVPADAIPGEGIDWAFYRDQILAFWQHRAARMGYVPSPDEFLQNRVNAVVTWLFAAGLAAGLPLFLIGAREWAILNMPASGRLLRICFYVAAAAALSWTLAWGAGMPALVGWKEAAVLFGMFALFAMKGGRQRELQS